MPDNQEQIESQLCAYVDDALDAKDRAEIERHLEANPQHRRLLDDLKIGRDLLRGLPREVAPPELTESFTGQLERSALLDGMGSPEPEHRLRIYRLPQIAAAAAIVMLASGLGAVVYFAMPGGRSVVASAQGLPQAPHSTAPPSATPLLRDAADDAARSLKLMPSEKKLDDGATADRLAKTVAPQRDKESGGFKEADSEKLEAVARDVSNNRHVQELLFGKPADQDAAVTQPAPREAVVMVVNSRDPNETRKQLAEYFTTNNIAWAPAPAAEPAKLDKLANDAAGEIVAGGGGAGNHREPAPQFNASLAKPAGNAKTDSVASAEGQNTNEPADAAAPAQPVPPSAPSPAPAPLVQATPFAQAAQGRGAGGMIDGQGLAQEAPLPAQNYNGQDQDAVPGGLYVARNVSRRQAVELGKNLNRAGAEQAALFANAFESNHGAPVRDLTGAASNDAKDARQRTVSHAAQQSLDRTAAHGPEQLGGLVAKGADASSTPATQPQGPLSLGIATPVGKVASQTEGEGLQRQAPESPASESQERRDRQIQQFAAAPHSYAKRTQGAPEESALPYSLAQDQAKQKAVAPTTAPANTEEAINPSQDEPVADNPVDLVIVVQNGTKEAPASILVPAPATQPAEQSVPAK